MIQKNRFRNYNDLYAYYPRHLKESITLTETEYDWYRTKVMKCEDKNMKLHFRYKPVVVIPDKHLEDILYANT